MTVCRVLVEVVTVIVVAPTVVTSELGEPPVPKHWVSETVMSEVPEETAALKATVTDLPAPLRTSSMRWWMWEVELPATLRFQAIL